MQRAASGPGAEGAKRAARRSALRIEHVPFIAENPAKGGELAVNHAPFKVSVGAEVGFAVSLFYTSGGVCSGLMASHLFFGHLQLAALDPGFPALVPVVPRWDMPCSTPCLGWAVDKSRTQSDHTPRIFPTRLRQFRASFR